MARNSKVAKKTQGRKPRPAGGKGRLRPGRSKVCRFCSKHTVWVDYKDVDLLARFLNDRGRIKSRGSTGTCAQHQRDLAVAIKTARELALLPYAVRITAADSADRRGSARRSLDRTTTPAETSVAQEAGSEGAEGEAGVEGPDAISVSDTQPAAKTSTVAAFS